MRERQGHGRRRTKHIMPSIKSPYPIEDLQTLMKTTDDIGVVLRLDFMLESALAHKCGQLFPSLNETFKETNTALCCNLLQLLGVPPDVWQPCRFINKLRHQFAHGKCKQIESKHSTDLAALMHDQFKGFAKSEVRMASDSTDVTIPAPEHLVPRSRLIMLAGLQNGYVLSLSGFFSTNVDFENARHQTNWQLMRTPKTST